MARPKKSTSVATASTAHPSMPTNGKSTLPSTAIKTFYGEPTGKRKGKAPSEKTLIVRAGLGQYPTLSPKALAETLNKNHPGFKITNHDVSQQKLQLGGQSKKSGKKGKGKRTAWTTTPAMTMTATVTVAPGRADMRQLVDLSKKFGTAKIRELCDLIDYVS
jgi:hypothetical protein